MGEREDELAQSFMTGLPIVVAPSPTTLQTYVVYDFYMFINVDTPNRRTPPQITRSPSPKRQRISTDEGADVRSLEPTEVQGDGADDQMNDDDANNDICCIDLTVENSPAPEERIIAANKTTTTNPQQMQQQQQQQVQRPENNIGNNGLEPNIASERANNANNQVSAAALDAKPDFIMKHIERALKNTVPPEPPEPQQQQQQPLPQQAPVLAAPPRWLLTYAVNRNMHEQQIAASRRQGGMGAAAAPTTMPMIGRPIAGIPLPPILQQQQQPMLITSQPVQRKVPVAPPHQQQQQQQQQQPVQPTNQQVHKINIVGAAAANKKRKATDTPSAAAPPSQLKQQTQLVTTPAVPLAGHLPENRVLYDATEAGQALQDFVAATAVKEKGLQHLFNMVDDINQYNRTLALYAQAILNRPYTTHKDVVETFEKVIKGPEPLPNLESLIQAAARGEDVDMDEIIKFVVYLLPEAALAWSKELIHGQLSKKFPSPEIGATCAARWLRALVFLLEEGIFAPTKQQQQKNNNATGSEYVGRMNLNMLKELATSKTIITALQQEVTKLVNQNLQSNLQAQANQKLAEQHRQLADQRQQHLIRQQSHSAKSEKHLKSNLETARKGLQETTQKLIEVVNAKETLEQALREAETEKEEAVAARQAAETQSRMMFEILADERKKNTQLNELQTALQDLNELKDVLKDTQAHNAQLQSEINQLRADQEQNHAVLQQQQHQNQHHGSSASTGAANQQQRQQSPHGGESPSTTLPPMPPAHMTHQQVAQWYENYLLSARVPEQVKKLVSFHKDCRQLEVELNEPPARHLALQLNIPVTDWDDTDKTYDAIRKADDEDGKCKECGEKLLVKCKGCRAKKKPRKFYQRVLQSQQGVFDALLPSITGANKNGGQK